MQSDLKQKWIEALRSGKYEQGQMFLNRSNTYCCLGVLCEISVSDSDIEKRFKDSTICYDDCEYELSYELKKKFDLTEDQCLILMGMNDGSHSVFSAKEANLEKRKYSFLEIADWIEKNL